MDFHFFLLMIQRTVALMGILIILIGIVSALVEFLTHIFKTKRGSRSTISPLNEVRLHLTRCLLLGLEFIVAADLIGTLTTPDYYSVGILAIIVVIRTVLSFTLNRELNSLSKQ